MNISSDSDFNRFVDQLKAVGITIQGESTLRAMVEASPDWTSEIVRIAQVGRKHGIRFIRSVTNTRILERVDAIMHDYSFKELDRAHVLNNIV